MKTQRIATAAIAGLAVIALSTSCAKSGSTASSSSTRSTTAVDTAWMPTGYTDWDGGTTGFQLVPDANCKTYQDGCVGINVVSKYGCAGGIYIEVAFLDRDKAAIDKANDITPAVQAKGIAKSLLSPPGGMTGDMTNFRLTKLNCL